MSQHTRTRERTCYTRSSKRQREFTNGRHERGNGPGARSRPDSTQPRLAERDASRS